MDIDKLLRVTDEDRKRHRELMATDSEYRDAALYLVGTAILRDSIPPTSCPDPELFPPQIPVAHPSKHGG
jgi:hypothetical protein